MQTMRFYIFCLVSFFMLSCGVGEKQVFYPIPENAEDVASESFGVTFIYSDSAIVTSKLMAPHVIERIDTSKGENAANDHYFNQGLKVVFFNRSQQEVGVLEADSGLLKQENGIAEMYRNVVVKNNNTNEMLETEKLFWDQEKDSIYSDRSTPVRITTPDKIILGMGLRANAAFSEYIIHEITGEIYTEDEEF